MAKRKRLEVPKNTYLETKSVTASHRVRMPIAEVARDTAGLAALEEVARELTLAEGEGRVVKKLPLAEIKSDHLSRDRLVMDPEEMEALKASISERGQQAPIEVVRLSEGKYGLISGLRRLEALRLLGNGTALAFVRQPASAEDAYCAMIEENEIRANLSFYERANIAVTTVEQGVYDNPRLAVKTLFAHVPKAKRSKILKFVTICDALGAALAFPSAIPEHLGFKLAKAMEVNDGLAAQIRSTLKAAAPETIAAERQLLEAALRKTEGKTAKPKTDKIAKGLQLEAKTGRVVLSGPAINKAFIEALRGWMMERAD